MNETKKLHYVIPGLALYLAIPIAYMLLGNFPERTAVKEIISIVTVGAFFLMLGQFYLSRINKTTTPGFKMAGVIKLHKILGYIFIPVIFLHPFLIVFPRYLESGVEPLEALTTILTTYGTRGIIIGIVAMVLMLTLGLFSLIRNKLPMKYLTWRITHGLLSIAFIALATWHAVDLGRHTDSLMSWYMIVFASLSIVFLLRIYISDLRNKGART